LGSLPAIVHWEGGISSVGDFSHRATTVWRLM
jgi:hypothetical protein